MDAERRARFVEWFNGPPLRGDRARLIKITGYTKGRVAQFFDQDQPFGQLAAKNLAIKLGLDAQAFERAGTAATGLSHKAMEVARLYDQLPADEKDRFFRVLDALQDAGPR